MRKVRLTWVLFLFLVISALSFATIGQAAMVVLDNFNRSDGPLGGNWTVQTGTFNIVNNAVQGGFNALATYNGITSNVVEIDVEATSTGGQYEALVIGYAALDNNLFIKVQNNGGSGTAVFDRGACYIGNNGTTNPFGLGFFTLTQPFTTAHMQAEYNPGANTVTITLSNIDGGAGTQQYVCTGAPATGGTGIGIGSGVSSNGKLDNFAIPSGPPSTLNMIVKGVSNNGIFMTEMTAPDTWGAWSQLSGSTSQAAGLAVFNNRLYMAVKGATNNNIYIRSMDSSGAWSGWIQVSGGTGERPALASFNNRLYLVVKGASNNNLYLRSMDTTETWDTSWTTLTGQTSEAPSLASFNGKIYLFVKGVTNSNIYYNSMDTGGVWGSWLTPPEGGGTGKTPSLTVFNNELYLFVKGASNNNLYYRSMDTTGAWDVWNTLTGQTSESPSVEVFGDELYIAVKGATNNSIYTRSWNGMTWDPSWTTVSGSTDKTPVLCTY